MATPAPILTPLPPRPISPFVSPSKSDALAECPHRYWQQQIHPTPDTREQQIGKAFHEFMPLYVKCLVLAGKAQMPEVVAECLKACGSGWDPDWRAEVTGLCNATARDWSMPAGFAPLGFEHEWAIRADGSATLNYTDPLAISHGKIDCAGMVQPDPKSQSWCWLFDWKTGGWDPEEIPVDRARIPKGRQPRYYLYAAHRLWKADNYVWATFHPRLGKLITTSVKRSQIEKAAPKILAEMQEEFDALALRLKLDAAGLPADAWPATACKWCTVCQFGPTFGDDSCPHYNQQQQGVSELRRVLSGTANWKPFSETLTLTPIQPQSKSQAVTEPIIQTAEQAAASEPLTLPVPVPRDWELSDDGAESPRFKIFIYGDTGTFKTRSILTAFADRKPTTANARLAVIDTENGTEHYQREFRFLRKVTTKRENIVDGVLNPPAGIETVAIDSFTDFCDLVQEAWKSIYLVRERGAGNKRDYYTLQPRDYSNITEEIRKMVRALIDRPDLNVVITAKPKAKYAEGELMQKTGETFDGFKRIPFFMDVCLHLTKGEDGTVTAETERDRTNRFPVGKWQFTPEVFAAVVQSKAASEPQTKTQTTPADEITPEAAQFELLRSAKESSRIDQPSYLAIVARIGQGATSAKQLTPSQRNELIEELEEIAASLPF